MDIENFNTTGVFSVTIQSFDETTTSPKTFTVRYYGIDTTGIRRAINDLFNLNFAINIEGRLPTVEFCDSAMGSLPFMRLPGAYILCLLQHQLFSSVPFSSILIDVYFQCVASLIGFRLFQYCCNLTI